MDLIIETQPLNFFSYTTDKFVRVFGTSDNPLFMAKDVAEILEYKNTRQAIIKNVDKEDRFLLKNERVSGRDSSNLHPDSILINESGLYTLIFRSNKPQAVKFRRWITSEVIPQIRKTGSYSLQQPTKEMKQIEYMKVLEGTISILERTGGLDDRDILLMRDLAKSNVLCDTGRIEEVRVDNSEWSVSRRLSEHFGITKKKAQDKCCAFGKVLKAKYKELYDENPPRRQQFVKGTIRMVNHYTLKDWIDFGDDLMEVYFEEFME